MPPSLSLFLFLSSSISLPISRFLQLSLFLFRSPAFSSPSLFLFLVSIFSLLHRLIFHISLFSLYFIFTAFELTFYSFSSLFMEHLSALSLFLFIQCKRSTKLWEELDLQISPTTNLDSSKAALSSILIYVISENFNSGLPVSKLFLNLFFA